MGKGTLGLWGYWNIHNGHLQPQKQYIMLSTNKHDKMYLNSGEFKNVMCKLTRSKKLMK